MIYWSDELVRRLVELLTAPEGYSEYTIADILNSEFDLSISRDAVHNKIRRTNLRSLLDRPITDIMPYYTKYRPVIDGDVQAPKKILDLGESSYLETQKPKLKILYLGDLHIPFQIDEQVQTAINRNLSADILVTAEVADCYSISRFNKSMSIPFEVEVDNIIRFFETVSNIFPLVVVIGGNHSERISKVFQKGIPPSLLFLVEDNLLDVLARPFHNVVIVTSQFFQINDAMFTHAEQFSKVDMKAAVNVYNTLNEWKNTLGLGEYRCLVQSHTHMLGSAYRGSSYKLMESGCLCYIPDYSVQGFYSRPQTNGYVVIVQNNGVTDFDLAREYFFETPRYKPNYNPLMER